MDDGIGPPCCREGKGGAGGGETDGLRRGLRCGRNGGDLPSRKGGRWKDQARAVGLETQGSGGGGPGWMHLAWLVSFSLLSLGCFFSPGMLIANAPAC